MSLFKFAKIWGRDFCFLPDPVVHDPCYFPLVLCFYIPNASYAVRFGCLLKRFATLIHVLIDLLLHIGHSDLRCCLRRRSRIFCPSVFWYCQKNKNKNKLLSLPVPKAVSQHAWQYGYLVFFLPRSIFITVYRGGFSFIEES